MIGDIYQILNNQDASVCTAMPQIKGPFLCSRRCLNYLLFKEELKTAVEQQNGRQSLDIINT